MTPFFPSASLAAGYFAACLLLAATPGADMALFLSRTLAGGRGQGFAAQAGANAGLVIHTFAAALGLSALLAASAEAYQAVKIIGRALSAVARLWSDPPRNGAETQGRRRGERRTRAAPS